MCVSAAVVDGTEAERGAPAADAVRDHRRELAGEPPPEGVAPGFLPGAAGYTLPGCRTGTTVCVNPLIGFFYIITNEKCTYTS